MAVLGIETSSGLCSAGIAGEGIKTIEIFEEKKNYFIESIYGLIDAVLDKSGKLMKDINGLAVSTGPGSFTGIRVGVAAAKGISHSLGIPVVGINTYSLLAANIRSEHFPLCCVIPFKRNKTSYMLFEKYSTGRDENGIECEWDDLFKIKYKSICGLIPEDIQNELKSVQPGINIIIKRSSAGTAAELGKKLLAEGIEDPAAELKPVYKHLLKFKEKKPVFT